MVLTPFIIRPKRKPMYGKSTSIDNSIAQKSRNVKNNMTTINNKSTQRKENNTSKKQNGGLTKSNQTKNDDNIRYMKKENRQKESNEHLIKSVDDIESKYKKQVDYMILNEDADYINIRNLVIKEYLRNKGIGQNILNDIINYANQTEKIITLTPTNAFNTKSRLKQWYKRNGFVENSGKNANFIISDTMYKLPENNNIPKAIDNQGRELSKQQQEYFKDSKVRDKKGNLLTVYHGTEDGGFMTFDARGINGYRFDNNIVNFFTDNRAMAETYTGDTKQVNTSSKPQTLKQIQGYIKRHVEEYEDGVFLTKKTDGSYLLQADEGFIKLGEYKNLAELSYNYKQDIENYFGYGNTFGGIYEVYVNITNPLVVDAKGNTWSNIVNPLTGERANTTNEIIQSAIDNGSYDGIIFKNIQDYGWKLKSNTDTSLTNSVIVTIKDSNQIKAVDNLTPSTTNNDIRFAKRTVKNKTEKTNAERVDAYIEQEIRKIEKTGNWDESIPVTKRSDIRKTIEDYLGLNIKKGKFRQQAYGIYKSNRDVIRTKEYKDMDTILHEVGHALDLGNRIKVDKNTLGKELIAAINKLDGYENETRTVKLEEGFAEVIREYTIIPEKAKAEYPQTIAVLEDLRQKDTDFNKFIQKVQEQTYNYIHQSPRNRELSNMSIGEQTDKRPLTKEWVKQEVMRNVYDSDYVLKSVQNEIAKRNGKPTNSIKASNNIYLLTRLANASHSKAINMLSEGYIDLKNEKTMPGLNKIGEILGNNPERYNDLRAYLVAQRDLEYKAKTLKTGLRSMDSKTVIEQLKNDTQIQEAAQIVYDTLDGVLQYAVDNHLIDEKMAKNLRESNAFYVPMQRVLENKGNNIGHRGAVTDIIKKRTGSELDVKDVLENIIANSANIIQQVDNNNALKALYNQGEEAGITGSVYDVIDTPMVKVGTANLSTWESELKKQGVDTTQLDLEKTIDIFAPNQKVDSRNLITSFIDNNGKRVYLQFNDELVFNAITGMDKEFMSKVLKINSKLNMPLRYGATMANIGFAIPNMISDTAQAFIYSTAGFIPVIDNAIGVLDVLTANNKSVQKFMNQVAPDYVKKINMMYTLYNQSGASSSTRMSQYRKSTQEMMEQVYGTNSKNLSIEDKFKPLKRLLDVMTFIPELSEQSTRLRVFEKNYDYYKNKGTSEMDSRIMAAIESRDATQDFSRTGNITREINQLIPFSAARVGSIYTFAEKVQANPKKVGTRIAVLTALAMAIKAIGYDDDEIEELNQRKKDDNFVFKVGDNVVTIKKPQGILRSMINLAEYIQDLATGHIEEGKEGVRLGEWLNNAIMDNMPADSITGLVPNAVAPLIENAINKDFYYNTDIVNSYDLDLPNKDQYYEYNSQLAIWLGSLFNYSPAKIDNLISGYFGGLGTQTTNIMDYLLGKAGITAEKAEMGAETNAIGKRFVVNVNTNSASIDEIYDRKTELTKLKNGGTISEEETVELETITDAISNLSKLNKQIKEIKKDLSMTGQEKAEQIKLLQQQRTDTARQALGKDLIYSENSDKIQSTQFYPTNSSLSKSGYTLSLTPEMKKEYEEIANEYYNKYANQGIYNDEKLAEIKSKAKEYAKNSLFQKYKSDLVKSKK